MDPGQQPLYYDPRDPKDSDELQRRLRALLTDAHRNEQTWRRFQALELQLMECSTVGDLLRVLLIEGRARFAWDAVVLMLHDPGSEIEHLLEHAGLHTVDYPDLVLLSSTERFQMLYGTTLSPQLGAYDPVRHADLFRRPERTPRSVALLPLVRSRACVGSLNLGADNPERFRKGMATDFLQHIAAVLAVCLDAAVARERLKNMGLTDALTGVNNRRFFDQRLSEEVARARRTRMPLSCVFMDIDHFKRINDTRGHAAGDVVLQRVAKLIRGELRAMDVVARYGGEEFAVLLVQAGPDRAAEVAERIRRAIETGRNGNPALDITISAGVATLLDRTGADSAALGRSLVERADRALYEAKAGGRNRVVVDRGSRGQRA